MIKIYLSLSDSYNGKLPLYDIHVNLIERLGERLLANRNEERARNRSVWTMLLTENVH